MKTTLYFLILISILGSTNENKSSICEDYLPAITTSGANTFGCCINGNLLIPRDGTGTFGYPDKGFETIGDPTDNNQYSEMDIKDFKSDVTSSLFLHIQELDQLGVGTHIINESNGMTSIDGFNHTYLHCRVFNTTTNSYQYYRSFENSGILKISRFEFVPFVKRIVSGTFDCKLKNSVNPIDIIEIKNGRFDYNGATLPNKIFP